MNYLLLAVTVLCNTAYNSINKYMGKTRLSGADGRFLYFGCVFGILPFATGGFEGKSQARHRNSEKNGSPSNSRGE